MNTDDILLKTGVSGFVSFICFMIFNLIMPCECAFILSVVLFCVGLGFIEIYNSDFYGGNNGTR